MQVSTNPSHPSLTETKKPINTRETKFYTAQKVNTLGYIIVTVLAATLVVSIIAMVLTKDISFTIVQSILGVIIASVISTMTPPSRSHPI